MCRYGCSLWAWTAYSRDILVPLPDLVSFESNSLSLLKGPFQTFPLSPNAKSNPLQVGLETSSSAHRNSVPIVLVKAVSYSKP